MTAQQQADREGRTLCRVSFGSVTYIVRAAEAMLWEWTRSELIFPVGGERYGPSPPPLPSSATGGGREAG